MVDAVLREGNILLKKVVEVYEVYIPSDGCSFNKGERKRTVYINTSNISSLSEYRANTEKTLLMMNNGNSFVIEGSVKENYEKFKELIGS